MRAKLTATQRAQPALAQAGARLSGDSVLDKLRALLSEIAGRNVFYTNKLRSAGLDETCGSIDEFIRRCPFTTKQELQENQRQHPPFGTLLTFPPTHYTRHCQTSASSGVPLHWLDTPQSWAWMMRHWDAVFEAAGIGVDQGLFFAFSFGPFLGFWTAFDAAQARGNLCLTGGSLNSQARLRMLSDLKPSVMCCTPTYAFRLAEAAQELEIDPRKLSIRKIIVAGEPGGSIPAVRAQIEQQWNAQIYDHHGMTEVGPVSIPCPARPNVLHVLEDEYLAEIIDTRSGVSLQRGHAGELVLTPLGRSGMPVLRYRTGDYVKTAPAAVCACGRRGLALEGGILSRTDDMLWVRGVNVFPAAVENIMREHPDVSDYRVLVQRVRGMLELKIEAELKAGCVAENSVMSRHLEEHLRSGLGLRIPVTIISRGELLRPEMKSKRWVFAESKEA